MLKIVKSFQLYQISGKEQRKSPLKMRNSKQKWAFCYDLIGNGGGMKGLEFGAQGSGFGVLYVGSRLTVFGARYIERCGECRLLLILCIYRSDAFEGRVIHEPPHQLLRMPILYILRKGDSWIPSSASTFADLKYLKEGGVMNPLFSFYICPS